MNGTNRNASHAAYAKLVVISFRVIKSDGSCRTLTCAGSAIRAIIVSGREWTCATLLIRAVAWQCERGERLVFLYSFKNGYAECR